MAFDEMLRRLVAAIVWNAFLVPFFPIALNQRGMARVFLVFASLFAFAWRIDSNVTVHAERMSPKAQGKTTAPLVCCELYQDLAHFSANNWPAPLVPI